MCLTFLFFSVFVIKTLWKKSWMWKKVQKFFKVEIDKVLWNHMIVKCWINIGDIYKELIADLNSNTESWILNS